MIPGVALLPSDLHYNWVATGSDVMSGEEVRDLEGFLNSPESLFSPHCSLPPLEMDGEDGEDGEEVRLDSSWNQDGDLALQESGKLERRWVLWHEFMKEHSHLDAWLRLAEQAVTSPNSAHVSYVTAQEELRKFERLRCESGSRLVQLDSLTRRNRTLTRLFRGTMRARLLAMARDCGRRWDDLNVRVEAITRRLKYFVSEREGFEAEREELALWLADLDIRLAEVEHLTGSTCDKMRQLQSFQECVCVNSGRVNALLERGEELIQRSEPSDAQDVETQLLDLLLHCSHVFNAITRIHTRLLSMRLVFEDECILSQAPDSGCPSETLLEDEGAFDKLPLDLPAPLNSTLDLPAPLNSTQDLGHNQSAYTDLDLPTTPPSPPTHEHLGLEWDPSVDIGGSASRDDGDSPSFSTNTGLCYRDGLKRRSFLSYFGSQSDIANDITNQEADLPLQRWLGHAPKVYSPVVARGGGTRRSEDQWVASTPDRQDCEPVSFDGGRVRAWLGVQSPALLLEGRTSCSKAVQTDWVVQCDPEGSHMDVPYQTRPHVLDNQHCHDDTQQLCASPTPSPDLNTQSDWSRCRRQSYLQSRGERSCEAAKLPSLQTEPCVTSSSRGLCSLRCPAFLYLLLAAALTLLACVVWGLLEPPCHRSNRLPRTFQLALRYVNGPPPT